MQDLTIKLYGPLVVDVRDDDYGMNDRADAAPRALQFSGFDSHCIGDQNLQAEP